MSIRELLDLKTPSNSKPGLIVPVLLSGGAGTRLWPLSRETYPSSCFRCWANRRCLGCKLSLQKHFHRAEHWVVVNGTALVTRDNEQVLLRENESLFTPLGAMHRLENPGKLALNLIEVQSGAYLGEDDIVRVEDIYNRVA
jgi:mannose-6-phosphate isomerase-like protein (cupin superfamily)